MKLYRTVITVWSKSNPESIDDALDLVTLANSVEDGDSFMMEAVITEHPESECPVAAELTSGEGAVYDSDSKADDDPTD